ncbi:DUF3761 domain-containing protein [Methylobacterium sp. P31]
MTGPSVVRRRRSIVARLALTAFVLLGAVGGAQARPFSEPDETRLDRHGHYRSRDGSEVHQPARTLDGAKPNGASAKCHDGTWSFSHSHRGTCSRHGGVAPWEG